MSAAVISAGSLLSAPILELASRIDLARILIHVKRREYAPGEVLYRAGEAADVVLFIEQGTVAVTRGDESPTRRAEGYLGVEAVLGARHYTDSVAAVSPLQVLEFPASHLRQIVGSNPGIERGFFEAYAMLHGRRTEFGAAAPAVPVQAAAFPWKELAGWLIALAIPLAALAATVSAGPEKLMPFGLTQSQFYFVAIIATTVTMWVFGLVPDFVPPLFSVLAILLLDVVPPGVALSGFTSPSFFMCMSVFGIGALMTSSGLSYRLSLALLRRTPSGLAGNSLSLFLSGMLLTPIVPSPAGRMAILSPFLIELIEAGKLRSASRVASRLIVSTLGGVALLIPLFLTASAPNLLVYGLFDPQTQFAFRWLQWLFAASVVGLILLAAFFALSAIMFRPEQSFELSPGRVGEQLRMLGRMSHGEKAALLAIGAMAIGVVTHSTHHIDIPWLALAIFVSLLLLGDFGTSHFRRSIDWPTLMFIGAIVGWVPAMQAIGIDVRIAGALKWLGAYMSGNLGQFVLALSLAVLVVRLAIPTTATAVLFATALFPVATDVGVSLWFVGFVVLMIADTFIFPYQSSYYVALRSDLAEHGLTAVLDERRIAAFNVIMIVVRILAIYASMPFWACLGVLGKGLAGQCPAAFLRLLG